MNLQELQAKVDALFDNLQKSGPAPVAATFVDAYTQATSSFPHTGMSEADQVSVGDIVTKSVQFLNGDQIYDMHSKVHAAIDEIPKTALLGYMTAMSGTVSALKPAQRTSLPELKLDPNKKYPLAVTRYQYHLANRK